jgi:hypothetical protein
MPNFLFFAAAMLVLAVCCFLLGYDVAETTERKARKDLDRHLKAVILQKKMLSEWVRKNWPDEYAAYHRGHAEGYQQGVLQAETLEEDTQT